MDESTHAFSDPESDKKKKRPIQVCMMDDDVVNDKHLMGWIFLIVDSQWDFTSQEAEECIHVRETLIR